MIRCYMYDGNVEPVIALATTGNLRIFRNIEKCPTRVTIVVADEEQLVMWKQVDLVISKLHTDVALMLSYSPYL
jgi:hypothetical protein